MYLCLFGIFAASRLSAEPTITYRVDTPHPKSGIPFEVVYDITWAGEPGDYAVIPSDPASVAWGTSRLVQAEAGSGDGGQTIRYRVECVADRPGTVQVPEFRVAYVSGAEAYPPKLEHTPATTAAHVDHAATHEEPAPELERNSIEAPPIDVKVGRYYPPELLAGAAAAGMAAIALGTVVALRVRRARARHENPVPGAATINGMINLARQHRLDGKFYEYYRALSQATTLAAPSVAARKLRERLEKDAQRVGYGALHPSDDELEGAMRDLERLLREPSTPQN